MPGDHFLQLQEVYYTKLLRCYVGAFGPAGMGGLEKVPVLVMDVYTGVLVFDPIKSGSGVREDTLHAIVPAGFRTSNQLVPVQTYAGQPEAVTVMAAPASIGGNPETVAVNGARAEVRLHSHIEGKPPMNLLVLSVDTAVAEGRLQRVAYQVTTLFSEPWDALRNGEIALDIDVKAE